MSTWQAGIDVGGTFTDLLFVDEGAHRFRVVKVPSTPDDQSAACCRDCATVALR